MAEVEQKPAESEQKPAEEPQQEEAPKNEEVPVEKAEAEKEEAPKNEDVSEKEKPNEPQPEANDANDAEVAPPKDDEKKAEPKNEEAQDDAKKAEDENPGIDFSGTWVLKSSSKSIDEYYKSEGWGYMMRKMAPFVPIKQILTQKGNKLTVNVIVGPGGKFANETATAIIGSKEEILTRDKDGEMKATSRWNEDKTQILSDMYRVANPQLTYKAVRALSMLSDDKMIVTTTNSHGKELVQNFERVVESK